MRRLFLRELRRQLPVALAVVILGALVAAICAVILPLMDVESNGTAATAALVALVGPLLLGVASVAPDAESGGAVFLATLPLPRWRELLARWGAAAVWSALLVGAALAWIAAGGGAGDQVKNLMVSLSATANELSGVSPSLSRVLSWTGVAPCLPCIALASGILASVTIRRALAALILAPAFPAIIFLGWEGLSRILGPADVFLAVFVFCMTPLLLLASGAVHLRGDIHRASRRPVAIALGVLACSLVLGFGLESACYAIAPRTTYVLRGSSIDPRSLRFAIERGRRDWDGAPWSYDLYEVDPASRTLRHEAPEGLTAVAESPSGRKRLFVDGTDDSFVLGDPDGKTGLERSSIKRGWSGWLVTQADDARRELGAWLSYSPSAWRGDLPLFVDPSGIRGTFLDGTSLVKPPGSRIMAAGGRSIVLRDPQGEWRLVGLDDGSSTPLSTWPGLPEGAAIHEARFSPSGRYLLLRASVDAKTVLYCLDIGWMLAREVPVPEHRGSLNVAWSPRESYLIIWFLAKSEPAHGSHSTLLLTDLGSGVQYSRDPSESIFAWSPSERRIAFIDGTLIELEPSGEIKPLAVPPALAGRSRSMAFPGYVNLGFLDDNQMLMVGADEAASPPVRFERGPIDTWQPTSWTPDHFIP